MTPATRWTASIAGVAAAALVALAAGHRSGEAWAARAEAEAAARADGEARMEEMSRERGEESAALQRRVAALESDLAREREQRALAEARAAKPAGDLAAAQSELDRAYGRIRELESAGPAIVGTVVAKPADDAAKIRSRECIKKIEFVDELVPGKRVSFAGEGPDRSAGEGLNQGVEYVPPPDAASGPQRLGEARNMGVDYADPAERVEKLTKLVKAIEDLREVQRDGNTVTCVK